MDSPYSSVENCMFLPQATIINELVQSSLTSFYAAIMNQDVAMLFTGPLIRIIGICTVYITPMMTIFTIYSFNQSNNQIRILPEFEHKSKVY